MDKEMEYIEEMLNSTHRKDCAYKEEYKQIAERAAELQEAIHNVLLPDDYEDFDKFIETMELKHKYELNSVYKKGILHGAFVQKLLCNAEDTK